MAGESLESHVRDAPEAAFDYGQLFDLVRRHASLIMASTVLSIVFVCAVVLVQTPVYRATAELLVSPQTLQVVGRDIVRTDSPTSLELANVDSQALVILSTSVLRQVARDLNLAADPEFQPRASILAFLMGSPPPTEGQKENAVLDLVKQSVVIHRVDNALVFQITVSNPNAARAAEIANALAAAYLHGTAQERVEAVTRADDSIIKQISGLRDQLNGAENAVERFRSENGLIRSSDSGLVVTQQLNNIYTQIDVAVAEVARLAARKEQVAKISPDALLTDTAADVLNSPTLTTLRAQYAQIAREAASQGRTLMPQHPRMLELRAELAEGRRQLQVELTRMRVSVDDSHAQALNSLKKLQAQAQHLTQTKVTSNEAETKLRQLESEAEAIRAVLNASLNRARELDQQGRIETNSSHVLTSATPPLRPSGPPMLLVVAAAGLFGACAGTALAYMLDGRPPSRGGSGMTARDAAGLIGTGLVVALPPAGRSKRDAPASGDLDVLLAPLASDLRARFRDRLPAVVVLAPASRMGGIRGIAERLGSALADLGEEVLLCDGTTSSGDVRATRIEARGPVAAIGRPAARRSTRPEFVVTTADVARSASAGSTGASADAVVLLVDLARTSPGALLSAARAIDPSRSRIAALVVFNAAAGTRQSRLERAMAGTSA